MRYIEFHSIYTTPLVSIALAAAAASAATMALLLFYTGYFVTVDSVCCENN